MCIEIRAFTVVVLNFWLLVPQNTTLSILLPHFTINPISNVLFFSLHLKLYKQLITIIKEAREFKFFIFFFFKFIEGIDIILIKY